MILYVWFPFAMTDSVSVLVFSCIYAAARLMFRPLGLSDYRGLGKLMFHVRATGPLAQRSFGSVVLFLLVTYCCSDKVEF